MDYQAKLKIPFCVLGIHCTDEALTGIEFLAPDTAPQPPRSALARKVCEQLSAYLADADFHFDLLLKPGGTAHQIKVWQAMRAIPRGQVQTYGDLAAQIGSSPRAVGQACGNNPIPIVIPCHRVVGKAGLGGFMHHSGGYALDIKGWLLAHEGAVKPEPVISAVSTLHSACRTTNCLLSVKAKIQSNKSAGFRVKPGMTKSK